MTTSGGGDVEPAGPPVGRTLPSRAGGPTRRALIGAAVTAGTLAVGGLAAAALGRPEALAGRDLATVDRSAKRLDRSTEGRRWRSSSIGTSVQGRPIRLYENVAPAARSSVLVIAALHGDERGTAPTAFELLTVPIPARVSAHVVPVANPDGWEAGTRLNANGVDLNRNFPYMWRDYDGGPAPASEPETQALMGLVERLRPTITVWIHEPYEYVGPLDMRAWLYADAWARGSRLGTRALVQHGGGETWTTFGAQLPSMLVEGVSRELSPDDLRDHRRGFEELLAVL